MRYAELRDRIYNTSLATLSTIPGATTMYACGKQLYNLSQQEINCNTGAGGALMLIGITAGTAMVGGGLAVYKEFFRRATTPEIELEKAQGIISSYETKLQENANEIENLSSKLKEKENLVITDRERKTQSILEAIAKRVGVKLKW
jgi:hypothetical protein